MRGILLFSALGGFCGCGAETADVEATVPCSVQILGLDGAPFADRVHIANSDGMVPVFVELQPATLNLDNSDQKGRKVQSAEDWELRLCIANKEKTAAELQSVGSLQYDDPSLQKMYSAELRNRMTATARPKSFASRKSDVVHFLGLMNVRGLEGQRRMVLQAFPTADKHTAIPTTRMLGFPVPLLYFNVEFLAKK